MVPRAAASLLLVSRREPGHGREPQDEAAWPRGWCWWAAGGAAGPVRVGDAPSFLQRWAGLGVCVREAFVAGGGAACLAQPGCLRLGARAWSGTCVAAELAGRSRPRSQCLRSAASRAMFLCSMPQAKPCSSKAQARRAPTLPSEGSCPRPRGHHTSPPSTDRCRRAVSLRSCTERWPPSTARTGEPHGPGCRLGCPCLELPHSGWGLPFHTARPCG